MSGDALEFNRGERHQTGYRRSTSGCTGHKNLADDGSSRGAILGLAFDPICGAYCFEASVVLLVLAVTAFHCEARHKEWAFDITHHHCTQG